jgi:hypothetical protein
LAQLCNEPNAAIGGAFDERSEEVEPEGRHAPAARNVGGARTAGRSARCFEAAPASLAVVRIYSRNAIN